MATFEGPTQGSTASPSTFTGPSTDTPTESKSTFGGPARAPTGGMQAEVLEVLDGDTVKVRLPSGRTKAIRVAEIDAPEVSHDKRGAQSGADEATKQLSDRISGKKISLSGLKGDPYGRFVASISVDGMNVGQDMLDKKVVQPYGQERTFFGKLAGDPVTPKEWRDEGIADAQGHYSWDRLKKHPISAVAGTVASVVDLATGLPEWASRTALTGAGIVKETFTGVDKAGSEKSIKKAEEFADKYTKEFHMDALTGLAGRAATAMGADPTMIGHAFDPVSKLYQAGQDALAEQGTKVGIAPAATRFAMDNIVAILTPKVMGKAHEVLTEGKPTPEYVNEHRARKEEQYAQAEKEEAAKPAALTETAIRDKKTGVVERMGPKHDEARKAETKDTHEQGFIDADGNFLERKDALTRAQETGQVAKGKKLDFPDEGLHSGDLRDSNDPRFQIKEKKVRTEEQVREELVDAATDAHMQKISKAFDLPDLVTDIKGRKLQAPKDLGLEKLPGIVKEEPTKFAAWAEDLKDKLGVYVRNEIKDGLMTHFDALKMEEIMPDKAGRERVWEAIQEGKGSELTGQAKKLYEFHQKVMDEIYQAANKVGAIKGYIQDYAARHIDMEHLSAEQKEALLKEIGNAYPSLQPTTKHGKTRTVTDFGELKKIMEKHDLKFKTTDLAEVFRLYAQSVKKAVRDTNKLNVMKKTRVSGLPVLMEIGGSEKIPPNYKPLRGSGMYENYAVHPDIYDAAKHLIGSNDPGMVLKAAATLSGAIKRVAVGFSLFHYGTLNVANFLTNKPMHSIESFVKTRGGVKRESLLKDPTTGRLSEEAKFQIDNGVTFGIISDSGVGAMDAIAQGADKLLGKVTGKNYNLIYKATQPARMVQKALDHMTWEITHDGLKYLAAQKKLEMARLNHPDIPDAVHMKEIARNINNTFGGLDWFSVAREGNSKFSEKIKMAAYSPTGRMGLQVLMFAPDWTMSTVRAVTHALPERAFAPETWDLSRGLQGLLHPLTDHDYSRQYMMRFALTSLTLANGLNVALSGKYIWENKDPFTIDLGDGTFLSPFKHAAEFYHWITDFDKTFYNKLGWLPKQLTEAAYDIRKDTPLQERLKNLVKGTAIPFTGSSAADARRTPGESASAFVGMPITGVKSKPMPNWERMKKNFQRKLGIKIKDDTDKE